MNKLVIAIALCAALAACKKEEAPAADAAAAPAAEAPAAEAAAAPAATPGSTLPQECQDYLARARACFSKAGNAAAVSAFDGAVKQAEAQWNQMADKSQLGPVCKNANDQFSQQAAALKCE
ncbi:hypothetical protein [Luteimonas aquatica]|uniref:hypothetical protein n=1 Tax=Luteimonas aquatica TaxID=450364 RepID=UPI001F5839C9|nr:hypothetical protein [Luteimonas aquatica]